MAVRSFSFGDCGGSFTFALTERKFGMIPRMRLVCAADCSPGVVEGLLCWGSAEFEEDSFAGVEVRIQRSDGV